MVLEFFLPFGRLKLSFLPKDKKTEMIEKAKLIIIKTVMLFEYGKTIKGYWDGLKLYQQVINKALPIVEAFYVGYSLLFLFNNATNHSVYVQDALRIIQINKKVGDKQPWLRNKWFKQDKICII